MSGAKSNEVERTDSPSRWKLWNTCLQGSESMRRLRSVVPLKFECSLLLWVILVNLGLESCAWLEYRWRTSAMLVRRYSVALSVTAEGMLGATWSLWLHRYLYQTYLFRGVHTVSLSFSNNEYTWEECCEQFGSWIWTSWLHLTEVADVIK